MRIIGLKFPLPSKNSSCPIIDDGDIATLSKFIRDYFGKSEDLNEKKTRLKRVGVSSIDVIVDGNRGYVFSGINDDVYYKEHYLELMKSYKSDRRRSISIHQKFVDDNMAIAGFSWRKR